MVTIVNAVGSGDLGAELALQTLGTDLSVPFTEYDPSNYHGLYVRLVEDGPLITVYRSGKYIISGCSSFQELETTNDEFISQMVALGICDLPCITKEVNCSPCIALVFRPVCSNEFDYTAIKSSVFERVTSAVENFDELVRIIIREMDAGWIVRAIGPAIKIFPEFRMIRNYDCRNEGVDMLFGHNPTQTIE